MGDTLPPITGAEVSHFFICAQSGILDARCSKRFYGFVITNRYKANIGFNDEMKKNYFESGDSLV
ncbi:hypothetical protein [Nitrosomonas sp.]|uniref:hypothetical protein n=1 Tax=Nitrosomonas sp. TaxID=42353 RepID=UPI0037CB32B1